MDIYLFFSWNLAYLEAVKNITQFLTACPVKITVFSGLSSTYNRQQTVETLYSNRVTSEKRGIHTPPLSPPFKVWVFVVF